MTSVLEKIVSVIAPHRCIICSKENNVMCESCLYTEQKSMPSVCCLCGVPSVEWQVCSGCRAKSELLHIWPTGVYEGFLERLICDFKFERVKDAAVPLGWLMANTLPYGDWLLVHVPTAASRVRQRGYDQARLLVKQIAKRRDLPSALVLERVTTERQVGANRVQRQKQSQNMFAVRPDATLGGAKIVLIDDVCTTGATLNVAAATLRAAGAAEVHACVAAWQPLR